EPVDLPTAGDTSAGSPDPDGPVASAPDAAPLARDAGAGTFENSLGMRFRPVPGTQVRFSIWETRVRDYQAYAQATGAVVPRPDFPEAELQPKAAISRAQAQAFADWLTRKEQQAGILGPQARYRLPTDAELDAAMQIGASPFPWGGGFPPPDHFANYGVSNDGFPYTAPVGSFPPNAFGLHDLAGNLWEWIGEGCASGGGYLVRGAGWNAHNQMYL